MLHEEVEALLHEPVDLEEVSADQNGDCVLDVQFGPAVLLDGRLLAIWLWAFVDRQLPAAAASSDALEGLAALLLLFVLLHREDVVEQPLKNDCVAVNADVYLILVRYLLQAFVEVFHVLYEERPREGEVALLVLAVIDHMNHYRVLEIRSFDIGEQVRGLLLSGRGGRGRLRLVHRVVHRILFVVRRADLRSCSVLGH